MRVDSQNLRSRGFTKRAAHYQNKPLTTPADLEKLAALHAERCSLSLETARNHVRAVAICAQPTRAADDD